MARFVGTVGTSRLMLREHAIVMATVLAVKLAWLLADATLRLYMGDSMVFMQAGASFSGVGARSYPYGWVLHWVAFPFMTPWAILLWQSLWGALTSWALFGFLRHGVGLPFAFSLVPALLLSGEPAQVFMERMVMAESFGLLAFVATLLLLSAYLARGNGWWYLMACGMGLLAGALRTNVLPVVMGLGVVTPLIRLMATGVGTRPTRAAMQLLLPFAMLVVSHVAYTVAYGRAAGQSPGYLVHTGMMRIGLVAPLVRPEHFEGTGVSGDILKQVHRPLNDHWQRGHHIWAEDGLWRQIERHSPNPELVARTVTRRAMLSDPVGLLAINFDTLGGYFNSDKVYWRMMDDKGVIAPSERDLELVQEWLNWDARGVDAQETPARRYFAASHAWLTACLLALAPLALVSVAMGWGSRNWPQVLLLAFASWGLVASHLLFAHIVSFRYLHSFPWFVLANLSTIVWFTIRRWRGIHTPSVMEPAGTPVP
ncbi:hypothetical protein GCM10028795_24960 [Lysobacter olei]